LDFFLFFPGFVDLFPFSAIAALFFSAFDRYIWRLPGSEKNRESRRPGFPYFWKTLSEAAVLSLVLEG
jgi:hypothetical protein